MTWSTRRGHKLVKRATFISMVCRMVLVRKTRLDYDNLGFPVEKEPKFLGQSVVTDLGLFLD